MQQPLIVPPGGQLQVVFQIDKTPSTNTPQGKFAPIMRVYQPTIDQTTKQITGGNSTNLPQVTLGIANITRRFSPPHGGALYDILEASLKPNATGDSGIVTVTADPSQPANGYLVTWQIPIDNSFLYGDIYTVTLGQIEDIVGNTPGANSILSATFKVGL